MAQLSDVSETTSPVSMECDLLVLFKDCHKCKPPKRKPGCQDHCPSYARDKKINDQINDARKRYNDLERYNKKNPNY